MVLVIPVNAGQFAEGWEQGRRSRWDDAERAERLKQDFVRTNTAQATQDSNIFSTNARNRYAGNNALRTDEYEGIMQPGKINLGLTGQRNDLNTMNQNFELSRAAHPGNVATARDASDLATTKRDARQRANYFTTRAGTEVSEDTNDLLRRETAANLQRPYIERDVAGADMLRRSGAERQYDLGSMQRAVQLGEGNIRQILSLNPESATQYLQQAGVLPQGVSVVPMRDESGAEVLGLPDESGRVVPLSQVMTNMYQEYARMSAAQEAQMERERERQGRGRAAAPAVEADPLGMTAPQEAAQPPEQPPEQADPLGAGAPQDAPPPAAAPPADMFAPQRPAAPVQELALSSAATEGAQEEQLPTTYEGVPAYANAIRQDIESRKQQVLQDPTTSEGTKQRRIALLDRELAERMEPVREMQEQLRRRGVDAVLRSMPGLAPEEIDVIPDEAMAGTMDDIRKAIAGVYEAEPDDRQMLQVLVNAGRQDLAIKIQRYLNDNTPWYMHKGNIPMQQRPANSYIYEWGWMDRPDPGYFGTSAAGGQ